MNNLAKKAELFSNIAIIIVAILLGTVLVRKYLLAQPTQPDNNAVVNNPLNTGTKLNLQDIDWSKNEQTLVLALSNSCHFCSESAPFYQRLAQSKGDTRLIAVLPQSVEDGQRYMEKLGVSVNEVRQFPFSNIGVQGTPTLILVDNKGMVINSWVGKLSIDKETEVLSKLEQRR
jgi:thioredoxin-related protein